MRIQAVIVAIAILLDKVAVSDGFLHDGFLREQLRRLMETGSSIAKIPQRGGSQLRMPKTAERVLEPIEEEKIHVAILSNRLTATAVTIGSVCRTSQRKIHFHVFSTDDQEFQEYFDRLQDCRGSELELQTIDAATEALLELNFEPVWWQNSQNEDSDEDSSSLGQEWGIQTPYTNAKHSHALNLLRFYLPYLPSLSELDKFVFLDDDVILQRDIAEVLDLDFQPGIAMLAGCQHWKWSENVAGNFEASWNMTVAETGYLGELSEVCDSSKHQSHGCVRPGLGHELASLSQIFDPESEFASRPLDRRAFNMGLNVFDTKTWKNLKLTHRFEQWVDASNKLRLFPQDTLAFGLGLAYLALGDTVQCYEPGPISHLVGMAFVSEEGFESAGWPLKKISEDAYALHYNGANKPWDDVHSISKCAKEKPTDFFEIWKKACEDVGICTCNTSGEVAEKRRDLQMSATQEYMHNQQVTDWLNARDKDFDADADDFEGDFFCGLMTWEDKCRLAVCKGPSEEPSSKKEVEANGGKIFCEGEGVLAGLSYTNGGFSSGSCVTYPGYTTKLCYLTDEGSGSICAGGGALTGIAKTTANGIKMKCCELTRSR